MGLIDVHRLRATAWRRPMKDVPVPELKGLLAPNGSGPPVVRVRGLTGNQMFLAAEAKANHAVFKVLKDAFASGNVDEIKAAMTRAVQPAKSEATAAETAYRIEILVMGVVDETGRPYLDYEDAVRIAEYFPTAFITLTTEILSLSGEGSSVGES
jgi:hypothetical protein